MLRADALRAGDRRSEIEDRRGSRVTGRTVGGDGGPVAAKEQKLLAFRRVCLWIFVFFIRDKLVLDLILPDVSS